MKEASFVENGSFVMECLTKAMRADETYVCCCELCVPDTVTANPCNNGADEESLIEATVEPRPLLCLKWSD